MGGLTAFIFARGGSKGIKDKNIRPVAGKPLIAHSIAAALGSRTVSRVVVSTDSEAIASAARAYGAATLMRPENLATDNAPELLAWKHALDNVPEASGPGGLFISLPATSPLRASVDVDNAVDRFRAGGCDILFGITPARRNPWLNMVTVGPDGLIRIVNAGSSAVRRQDVPEVFDITTCVYVADPAYLRNCARIMEGRVGYVEIPAERALDIDDPFDLHLAELLLNRPFKGPEGGV